jgi:hypothetical protein
MTQLTTKLGMRVLDEEARLTQQAQQAQQAGAGASGGEGAEEPQGQAPAATDAAQRTQLRRRAMGVLLGETLQACVIMVKEEGSQVVLSGG